MTGQAVDRRLALVMAIHTEAHRVIDATLCDGLLSNVSVASRALDLGADVGRMVEPDVIDGGETVHALPVEVDALLAQRRDLLDARPICGNRRMADHAGADAGNTGHRSCCNTLVANIARDLLADVDIVWKLEWLLGHGTAIQKIVERGAEGGTRGCVDARGLARKHGQRRPVRGRRRLEQATADSADQGPKAHTHNPGEAYVSAQRVLPLSAPCPWDPGYGGS
jgi:hypothetical protein